jgi:hypothetical protein
MIDVRFGTGAPSIEQRFGGVGEVGALRVFLP